MVELLRNIIRLFRGEVSTNKLVKKGLIVGDNFSRQGNCIIDPPHCWLIEIGNNVTLASGVYILAHDASTKKILGYAKIGNVKIGDNVFIGAKSIILPNVNIGNNTLILLETGLEGGIFIIRSFLVVKSLITGGCNTGTKAI